MAQIWTHRAQKTHTAQIWTQTAQMKQVLAQMAQTGQFFYLGTIVRRNITNGIIGTNLDTNGTHGRKSKISTVLYRHWDLVQYSSFEIIV